jgi:hypothetical protein
MTAQGGTITMTRGGGLDGRRLTAAAVLAVMLTSAGFAAGRLSADEHVRPEIIAVEAPAPAPELGSAQLANKPPQHGAVKRG